MTRTKIVPEKSQTRVAVLNQAMLLITHRVRNILGIRRIILNMDNIMSEQSTREKSTVQVSWTMNHWPWTPYSSLFFVNLKPVEISNNHKNIICTSIKVVQICKVWRVWQKNQACHAHFSFEIQLAINLSILELKTFPSGFGLLRYRVKNLAFRAKQYLCVILD